MRLPSNCILWALWMWLRHGGYVRFRRSTHYIFGGKKRGWWPHVSWSRDGRHWWSYGPQEDLPPLYRACLRLGFPPPLYFGVVREEVD